MNNCAFLALMPFTPRHAASNLDCHTSFSSSRSVLGSKRFRKARLRPGMTLATSGSTTIMSPALDISGKEIMEIDAYSSFVQFFRDQSGSWNSERTYHYTTDGKREDSATTFDVSRLTSEQVQEVLSANGDATLYDDATRQKAQGFQVSFLTRMASQEELVRSSTNLAFIPTMIDRGMVRGKYYRLLGYEESGPQKADFNFDVGKKQLNMITHYTRVVSVDEITLIHPTMRIRKIINFARPEEGHPPTHALLLGFGVEKKCASDDEKLLR